MVFTVFWKGDASFIIQCNHMSSTPQSSLLGVGVLGSSPRVSLCVPQRASTRFQWRRELGNN